MDFSKGKGENPEKNEWNAAFLGCQNVCEDLQDTDNNKRNQKKAEVDGFLVIC